MNIKKLSHRSKNYEVGLKSNFIECLTNMGQFEVAKFG